MEDQAGFSASMSTPGDVSCQSSITAQNAGVANVPQLTNCQINSLNMHFPTNVNSLEKQALAGVGSAECRGLKRARETLKSKLKKKFEVILEGIVKRGNPTFLRDIYTELYITEGESGGLNKEHEVWQIDTAFKTPSEQNIAVSCNDIFKPLNIHDLDLEQEKRSGVSAEPDKADKRPPRTVVTKGIAGIGKTVSVQKFILDWAEGKANQDIDLLLVLPFRELNRIKDEKHSLHELLLNFHSELKEYVDLKYYDDCKILFIFDGLDESKLPFNFGQGLVSDVYRSASLDELMTNLIDGTLLPSALIWITSRPAAIDKIPARFIHRMTEIRGFTDSQKEEYFRKRYSNQSLATRIISHVKDSRSLEIMCYIPIFCWITATVLEQMLGGNKNRGHEKIPSSLTELYTRFLLIQMSEKKKKYHGVREHDPRNLSEEDVQLILKLGEMAFYGVMKTIFEFSEDDLKQYNIDVTEASLRSGVFTEIIKEEDPMFSEKMYSFVHLSFQEYFAAIYVFHTFADKGENAMEFHDDLDYYDCWSSFADGWIKNYANSENVPEQEMSLCDLQKCAIDEALRSTSGHLDLFLRFLLGLSLESNQKLLKSFSLNVESWQASIQQTVQYLKSKLREEDDSWTPSSERSINLFQCLLELNDHSIAEEIRRFLTSDDKQAEQKLTAGQCSALTYIIHMSEEVLEELDLKQCSASKQGCRRLIPAVRNCKKALMADCGLNESCCETLASALQSSNTILQELDLSLNFLGSRALKSLHAALNSPNCRLESLNLSHINLEKSGADLLRAILMGPHIQPHALKLCGCSLRDECAEILTSALCSSECQLTELDLSYNNMTSNGVESVLQGITISELEILRFSGITINEDCCLSLASVLPHSNLKELTLDSSYIGDIGVKHLYCALMNPCCQLQMLRLKNCKLSNEACLYLSEVLSNNSVLRELNLGDNDLQDSGVYLLSTGLKNPSCTLQNLGLSGCMITEKGCSSLASALKSNPSHLKELDLSYNHPGQSGEELLCDPRCKLKTLNLDHGGPSRLKRGHLKYYQVLHIVNHFMKRGLEYSSDGAKVSCYEFDEDDDKWEAYMEQMTIDEDEGFDQWDFFDWYNEELLYKWEVALCSEQLIGGRFYWEVEWTGLVSVGVTNSGNFYDSETLRLILNQNSYHAIHTEHGLAKTFSTLSVPKPEPHRIGVLLDWPGGTLSFYSVSSLGVSRLYTFHTTFNKPMYPEFQLAPPDEKNGVSSISIAAQTQFLFCHPY